MIRVVKSTEQIRNESECILRSVAVYLYDSMLGIFFVLINISRVFSASMRFCVHVRECICVSACMYMFVHSRACVRLCACMYVCISVCMYVCL